MHTEHKWRLYDIKDSSCVYLKVNKGCTRKSNEKLTRTCLGYISCFWQRASFGCIYLQGQWVQSPGGGIKSTFDNCKEFKSIHMRDFESVMSCITFLFAMLLFLYPFHSDLRWSTLVSNTVLGCDIYCDFSHHYLR